ncbi:MAG: zinc ABC transporter substrate-binding protein [Fibrobacter sp.]|nr:zinc ABC transporter substrate-binding protein [Fibrobacter sp.]
MKFRVALALAVCLFAGHSFANKLTIAVTLQPYAKLVHQIGGDKIQIVTMIPPEADPHTYEPKPSILKEFSKASIYFSDNSGIDEAWLPRFKGVNKGVKIVWISEGISWIKSEHHHEHELNHNAHKKTDHTTHDDDDENEESLDPHLWTSPIQLKIIADNMCKALTQADSKNADYYAKQTQTLKNRLDSLDARLRESIEKLPQSLRTFIVFHPSYGYFARDYGMTQIAVEVDGKEPKPKDLFNLSRIGKKNNVHIVFVQPEFSKRAATTIARELNAVILDTNPLDYDYERNIIALLNAITGQI